MLRHYLTIAIRTLHRQKLDAGINVFGLALGMACCILMLAFVRHEASYDAFHKDAEDIYRVNIRAVTPSNEVEVQAGQPLPLAEALESEIPEVRSATRIFIRGVDVVSESETFESQALFSDASFFEVFSFPILHGGGPVPTVNAVAITESAAIKFFGDTAVAGKSLHVDVGADVTDFTVAAVLEDPPATSSIDFEIVLPITASPSYPELRDSWSSWAANTFIRVDGDPPDEDALQAFAQAHYGPMIQTWQILQWLSTEEGAFRLELEPLTSIHFSPDVKYANTSSIRPAYLYVLAGISVAVLLVACINFAVLAVGRSTKRAREIGLRRTLGAKRSELMRQFWGEAVWLSLLALLFAAVLARALLPALNAFTGRAIELDYTGDPTVLAGLIALALITGLVAGFYPAIVLSGFRPIEIFRTGPTSPRGGRWIRGLVVTQFALAIFIIAAVLVGSSQLRFLRTKHIGLDVQRVMVVPTHASDPGDSERTAEVLEREMRGLSSVASVSAASMAFHHDLAWNSFNIGDTGHTVYVSRVRPEFIETLDMRLVAGRTFDSDPGTQAASIIVNEAFVRDFDLEDPIGQRLEGVNIGGMEEPYIIGVVEDFHFQSLYNEIQPVALFTASDLPLGYVYVRFHDGDIATHVRRLEEVWSRVRPDRSFAGYFLEEDFDRLYRTEERWYGLVRAAAIFTLLIACLGLFGLVSFSAQQRTREIGIRKVLGAGLAGLVALLSREYLRLVLIAFILAAPVAYLVLRDWLERFAYRIAISPVDLVLAGTIVLFVAAATVSFQAARAATADPAATLRHE